MADHDPLAEQAILGSIMLSGGRAFDVLEDFDPSDYFRPQHEELHRALAAMAKRGEPIDNASAAGAMGAIRGMTPDYFVDLSQAVTAWQNADHHAGTVSRWATLRRARALGTRLIALNPALAQSADQLDAELDVTRADLNRLRAGRASPITLFADVADAAIDSIGNQAFTPTPWDGLNHLIRGWSPSQMYVIGARPATGKTVVAVQAAVHAALTAKMGVAYYTFEMSAQRLYQRALASIAKVDIKKIQDGNLSEAEWRSITRADRETLRDLPVVVEGSAGWSAQQLVTHAKVAHRKHALGLIVVDHIGRIAPGDQRRHSREQEVADAANRLLDLAHQVNAAVIVCTQLNRQPSQRADPRPVATDIRESDVLEQNADCVILMHRDRENSAADLDLLVAKNRDGVDGPVRLTFQGQYSRAVDREWSPTSALGNR